MLQMIGIRNVLLSTIIQLFGYNNQNLMNLKQRMQQLSKNNSQVLNNSNFEFAKLNKQDQKYQKSRQQCEQELYKRKSQLEQQKYAMSKMKQKQLNAALEKFSNDFQELSKQIVGQVNLSLSESKAKFIAEIRQRCLIQTNQEQKLKHGIDELLNQINANLIGLRKEQYREYIAKIVTTDFDAPKQELKAAIRSIKHPAPTVNIDNKYYSCLKNDLTRAFNLDIDPKRQLQNESIRQGESAVKPSNLSVDINLHENRDRLKKNLV